MQAMKKYNQWIYRKQELGERLPHEPTPEEIRAMCEEIQKTWSPRVRQSRRVVHNSRPKVIEVNGLWITEEILSAPEMPQDC